MTVTQYLRNIPYRGYSLQVMHQSPQWHVAIASTETRLPELLQNHRTVRGWDQEEVVTRAKARIDELIGSAMR
jgi:hypothetical protein